MGAEWGDVQGRKRGHILAQDEGQARLAHIGEVAIHHVPAHAQLEGDLVPVAGLEHVQGHVSQGSAVGSVCGLELRGGFIPGGEGLAEDAQGIEFLQEQGAQDLEVEIAEVHRLASGHSRRMGHGPSSHVRR